MWRPQHDPRPRSRAAAERFGDHAGVRRGRRRRSPSPSCSTGSGATARGLRRARARARRPGRASGRRTASTGWSPRSPCRTPAARSCPVNSRYTGHEVADIVDRTGARLVVVADGFLGRTQIADLAAPPATSRRCRAVDRPRSTIADLDARSSARPRPTIDAGADAVSPDDVADILFTSGTTGRPQGRDVRAPADRSASPARGASSAASPRRTATSWSTRSSTPSATRSASSSAC